MKKQALLITLLVMVVFTASSGLGAFGQSPPKKSSRGVLSPQILEKIKRLPKPAPVTARRGVLPTYKLNASGTRQLASNIALAPTPKGTLRRQIPVQFVGNQRVKPNVTGLPPISLNTITRPAAQIIGVVPEEVVPGGQITVSGSYYDDSITLTITHAGNPTLFDRSFNLPAHHTEEFGDYVDLRLPADIKPGNYWVSVWNKAALGSNPGYFKVKASYPAKEYLVARLDSYETFSDYDTGTFGISDGTGPGELTYTFGASTGKKDAPRDLQKVTYGENGENGFLVSSSLKLVPGEIQLPFFSLPRDRMGDALMLAFVGQELDESTSTDAWEIAGGIIGAAAGTYFNGVGGLQSGFTLGSELGKSIASIIHDDDDNLGLHTNSFLREDDFGLNTGEYPGNVDKFDNNNVANNSAKVGYRILSVDAPKVSRLTVRINSVDTSAINLDPAPPPGLTVLPHTNYKPKFYVLARAFDGPFGTGFAPSQRYKLVPEDTKTIAKLEGNGILLFNKNEHYMPFVYIELGLWYEAPIPGQKNRMAGRIFSKFLLPEQIIQAHETSKQFTRTETVAAHPGAGSGGTFKVTYTISVTR